jgi:hypothetical protein
MMAARYHFDRHRRRFIACRGQVRKILAAYPRRFDLKNDNRPTEGGLPASQSFDLRCDTLSVQGSLSSQ